MSIKKSQVQSNISYDKKSGLVTIGEMAFPRSMFPDNASGIASCRVFLSGFGLDPDKAIAAFFDQDVLDKALDKGKSKAASIMAQASTLAAKDRLAAFTEKTDKLEKWQAAFDAAKKAIDDRDALAALLLDDANKAIDDPAYKPMLSRDKGLELALATSGKRVSGDNSANAGSRQSIERDFSKGSWTYKGRVGLGLPYTASVSVDGKGKYTCRIVVTESGKEYLGDGPTMNKAFYGAIGLATTAHDKPMPSVNVPKLFNVVVKTTKI